MIAMTPAAGPRPTMMMKMIAQTRSGTVRKRAITARATVRTAGWGDSRSVARMAKGSAKIRPSTQPATAICRVSSSFQPIGTMRLKSGGNICVSRPEGATSRARPFASRSGAGAVAASEDTTSAPTARRAA